MRTSPPEGEGEGDKVFVDDPDKVGEIHESSAFILSGEDALSRSIVRRYPTIVGFRPLDGAFAEVNPPRFSWPYLPGILPGDDEQAIPIINFDFQLSRSADFAELEVNINSTPYNFYNALAPLASGKWYWRVAQNLPNEKKWSEIRSFTVTDDTPAWDRSVFNNAAKYLGSLPRPRIGPDGDDWEPWARQIESRPLAQSLVRQMKSDYLALLRSLGKMWTEIPATDTQPPAGTHIADLKSRTNRFVNMGRACAIGAYLWRLTGEPQYGECRERLLALASYSPGGLSSPEAVGGHTKMTTQLIEFMALSYDVLYHQLSEDEKRLILSSIEWRLRSLFLGNPDSRRCSVWYDGENIASYGVAVCAHSHPYQNLMWAMSALPLLAGDLPLADKLIPLCLNYHAGVTAAHGMDEGWTEGVHYATEKSETMMRAARIFDLMMPELRLGSANPMIARLSTWLSQMLPIGLQRQPFGDLHNLNLDITCRNQTSWFWLNSEVTSSPISQFIYGRYEKEYGKMLPRGLYSRPWVDIYAALRSADEKSGLSPAVPPRNKLFADAGWVSVNSRSLSGKAEFNETVGMIFQSRPSGGFSHSYASDGSFVWYAYGQTLAAGGGTLFYPDSFSRESIAHNVMLIDGRGQTRINERKPYAPVIARIVAWHETENTVAWTADLSNAYPLSLDPAGEPIYEIDSYLRHVVFVDNRWFVVFDDISMKKKAARFSWLYHADHPSPLGFRKENDVLMASYRVDDVSVELTFASSASELDWINLEGEDGFRNHISGEDFYPQSRDALWGRRRMDIGKIAIPHNNIWVTNRNPSLRHVFLAALVPFRGEHERIQISPISERRIIAVYPDGSRKKIAFDNWGEADIIIDAEKIRIDAEESRKDK